MSALVISPQQERLFQQQLDDSMQALFAAKLDQALGRGGIGHAKASAITRSAVHGGALNHYKAAIGHGLTPPSHEELEAELGEGFGDFFRGVKKHGLTLAGHVGRIGKEVVQSKAFKDAAIRTGKAVLDAAAAGHKEGGVKAALKGGLASAADVGGREAAAIARAEAQRRIAAAMM